MAKEGALDAPTLYGMPFAIVLIRVASKMEGGAPLFATNFLHFRRSPLVCLWEGSHSQAAVRILAGVLNSCKKAIYALAASRIWELEAATVTIEGAVASYFSVPPVSCLCGTCLSPLSSA